VAEEIVQQLRGLILRGAYSAGDKLPPERKLAEELGVNRASLREAIKTLEHLGLVKTRQGDGTRVLDFMQTAGIELISHLVAGDPNDQTANLAVLLDVLEFRRWFGRECARLAAERATNEELRRLEAIADRAADPDLDAPERVKLDFELYVSLTHAAKNRVMQLLINTIRSAVDSYAPLFARFHPSAQEVREHHRALLSAIAKKDSDAAGRIADAYLARSLERLAAASS
jgi:GntR family transcriptional repressor for pyruvate dehydrogenase complex